MEDTIRKIKAEIREIMTRYKCTYQEALCCLQAVGALPFREGGEVKALTGSQGYGDAVVVMCVVINHFLF